MVACSRCDIWHIFAKCLTFMPQLTITTLVGTVRYIQCRDTMQYTLNYIPYMRGGVTMLGGSFPSTIN